MRDKKEITKDDFETYEGCVFCYSPKMGDTCCGDSQFETQYIVYEGQASSMSESDFLSEYEVVKNKTLTEQDLKDMRSEPENYEDR